MKRYVSIEEISDGKKYRRKDMVKADCNGCKGCSECCHGMGNSIVLDPYDIYQLGKGLNCSFRKLLEEKLELTVIDGVVLPCIKMHEPLEQCGFLDDRGRCSIHEFRPGICRLFPLGRYYEEGRMFYILQTGECSANRTKVKVEKWLGLPSLPQYEEYICDWHYYLNGIEEAVKEALNQQQSENANQITLKFLQTFFMTPYDVERDFYSQYQERRRCLPLSGECTTA